MYYESCTTSHHSRNLTEKRTHDIKLRKYMHIQSGSWWSDIPGHLCIFYGLGTWKVMFRIKPFLHYQLSFFFFTVKTRTMYILVMLSNSTWISKARKWDLSYFGKTDLSFGELPVAWVAEQAGCIMLYHDSWAPWLLTEKRETD